MTAQINELTRIAREESDFASDQFMQWFIKEQVEEVATMSALVTVVRRSKGNIEAIEEYIQREQREFIRPDGPGRRGRLNNIRHRVRMLRPTAPVGPCSDP